MSENAEISAPQSEPSRFDTLLSHYAMGRYNEQVSLASELLTHFEDKPPEDIQGKLTQAVAAGLYHFGRALLFAMSRNFAQAAQQFSEVLRVVESVPDEFISSNGLYELFRNLELNARIQVPLSECSECMFLGSLDAASRELQNAGAQAKELIQIMSANVEEKDLPMRPLAAILFMGYFMAGSFVHMQNASRGKRLTLAKSFFEETRSQISQFETVSFDVIPGIDELMDSFLAISNAANIRVEAEFAVEELRYADALELYDQAVLGFSNAAQKLPASTESPQITAIITQLRDVLVNMPIVLEQGIRLVGLLKKAQDDMNIMARRDTKGMAEFQKREERYQDQLSDFARNKLSMHVVNQNANTNTVENQIENVVTLQQELVMSAQNGAMDEVLKLLRKLEPDKDVTNLEEKARAAKTETDLATKIKKVVEVIDGASKIIDAAAKVVPYGSAVLAALKATYAGWKALSADGSKSVGD